MSWLRRIFRRSIRARRFKAVSNLDANNAIRRAVVAQNWDEVHLVLGGGRK